MAKTTKKSSAEPGQATVKPIRKKAASKKTGTKKVSIKSTVTGKKASSKKAVTKKQPVAKKTAARKATTKKKAATGVIIRGKITYAERHEMIAETAYLRAESQGFLSDEREDWLRAEADVDSLLTRAGVIVTE